MDRDEGGGDSDGLLPTELFADGALRVGELDVGAFTGALRVGELRDGERDGALTAGGWRVGWFVSGVGG